MKDFNFEYTNSQLGIKLSIICFSTFLFLLLTSVYTKDYIGIIPNLIIVFVIPFLIIWFNRNRIKIFGEASIGDGFVDFKTNEINRRVEFNKIESYLIQTNGGTFLRLILTDGFKIKITANANFCNTKNFNIFCECLEQNLCLYKSKSNIEIVKDKTFYEKKWLLYFLFIGTVILITLVFFILFYKNTFPTSAFMILGPLLALWGGYFNNKSKNKFKNK